MQPRSNLYFIAIIPPEPVYSEIREFQQHIAEAYKSKEALRRPIHATLINPFRLEQRSERELMKFIESFASNKEKFELAIDGFGSFSIGVIYAAVVATEALKKLEKDLSASLSKQFGLTKEKGPNYRFTPHITIGYKDLTSDKFPLAWSEYKDKLYRRKWVVSDIHVLRHDEEGWVIIENAELGAEKGDDMFS